MSLDDLRVLEQVVETEAHVEGDGHEQHEHEAADVVAHVYPRHGGRGPTPRQ